MGQFWPCNGQGSPLGVLRRMSAFLIKGTTVAGASLLLQSFCHPEGKAKAIAEVPAQTDVSC